MALSSPGVEVKVIDESFYTPAEPGTVPMIFVASAQDKTNGAGTGTAPGTLLANAGKPYLITSQRDLVETFGVFSFSHFEQDLCPILLTVVLLKQKTHLSPLITFKNTALPFFNISII